MAQPRASGTVPSPGRGWNGGGGKEFAILRKQDGHLTPDCCYDGYNDDGTAPWADHSNPCEYNDDDSDNESYETEGI